MAENMQETMKNKVSKFKRILPIRPYVIFSDIMKCFMTSCGTVLLICFFNFEQVSLTDEIISRSVFTIFSFLVVILFSYEMSFGVRWFHAVAAESLLGEAIQITQIDRNDDAIAGYNRKVIAVHEAGHAVMAYLKEIKHFNVVMSCTNPRCVTVHKLQDAEDIKNIVLIKYAGAIAEEMVFGYFHAGSFMGTESDFLQATDLIKGYIVMIDPNVSKSLLNEELSGKIIWLSKEFWDEATGILTENKAMIEILSKELVKRDTLNEKEVKALLSKVKGNICVE